jgi:hypothetical protein
MAQTTETVPPERQGRPSEPVPDVVGVAAGKLLEGKAGREVITADVSVGMPPSAAIGWLAYNPPLPSSRRGAQK